MHICPQELMMVIGAVEHLRPAMWFVKQWCQSCYDGTHKSCADHENDKSHPKEALVPNAT
jgi:hypothetical protein